MASTSISCTGCDADIHLDDPRWISGIEAFCSQQCYGRHQGRIEARESLFETAEEIKQLWWMLETKAENCLKAMREVNGQDTVYHDYELKGFDDAGALFEYQWDRDEIQRITIPWATLALPEADLIPTLERERAERDEADRRKALESAERKTRDKRESDIALLKQLKAQYPEVK